MESKIIFYKDKIAINCLARDLDNAKDIVDALDGNACVGLISSDFPSIEDGVKEVNRWLEVLPCVSVGLGAGNPKYAMKAALIAGETNPGHVNQPFPFSGYTAGYLKAKNANNTYINSLISPSGVVGKVKVGTGVLSSNQKDGLLDVETAIALILDMGAHSVKFFPMSGLNHIEEFKHIAKVANDMGMELIEPTGGITADNLIKITEAALNAGIKRCMPHIYTSIINKDTGLTELDSIKKIYQDMKSLVG